jgi:hypothetical protein
VVACGWFLQLTADHPVDRDGAAKLKPHSGELVRIVRETTRRYQDVNQATADGYQLLFGCVSGPDDGAMGMHYVNLSLVADGVLDPRRPEIVIYEPQPNGGRKLIGADFLVFFDAWHANNTGTPELGGQLMAQAQAACDATSARRQQGNFDAGISGDSGRGGGLAGGLRRRGFGGCRWRRRGFDPGSRGRGGRHDQAAAGPVRSELRTA